MREDDAELDAFKTDIDLRQYAASRGYEVDKRECWRGSTVMRQAGDKIVIKRNINGHYVYFSVRDDADNGTIIDFVQNRQRLSLGSVRKALREWTGRPPASLPLFPKLVPASKDRMRVETEYRRRMLRLIPIWSGTAASPLPCSPVTRFAGRVRIDGRGNAIFPHFDQEGLCGYEIKNRNYTGFAAGGEKGLWVSRTHPEDNRLVLAESAIDALSHAALFPDTGDARMPASAAGPIRNSRV